MTLNSYPIYKPGTIIRINYSDVATNLSKVGIFFVFYDEGMDLDTGKLSHNILAFKITSNPKQKDNHAFFLSPIENTFLTKPCYILPTKHHLFHKRNITDNLGVLDLDTLTDFYYESFAPSQLSLASQLIDRIREGENKL